MINTLNEYGLNYQLTNGIRDNTVFNANIFDIVPEGEISDVDTFLKAFPNLNTNTNTIYINIIDLNLFNYWYQSVIEKKCVYTLDEIMEPFSEFITTLWRSMFR